MNINQLRTLKELAQCKSFSLAAEKLHLTQPAVSFQIHSLEEHFGARLVNRSSRRKAELTEEGRLVLDFAQKALAGLARTEYQINEMTQKVRGSLRVGASTVPGEYILPFLIGAFRDRYPKVKISLEIGGSDEIRRKVSDQCVDLGIVGAIDNRPQLVATKVLGEELILIVPQNHRWPSGFTVCVNDLSEEDFILREQGSGTRQVFVDQLKEHGLNESFLHVVMELGSTEAILTAVEANLGISVVSSWAADRALALGQVRKIKVKDLNLKRDLYLIVHRQAMPNRAQEEFQNFVSNFQLKPFTCAIA